MSRPIDRVIFVPMSFSVSVVIPTFNRCALIGATLDSVLAQSHPAAEIVVVDDGSTDSTENLIRRQYPSVRYIKIPNSGPPGARNVGVAATQSEWIAFLDSDDLWEPGKLQAHARLAELSPEVPYSFSNFRIVEGERWRQSTKFDATPAGYFDVRGYRPAPGFLVCAEPMVARLLRSQPVFPSTVLLTRQFFEKVGPWDETLGRTRSEDLDFALRCVAHAPIGIVEAPLVGIRKHAANYSGNLLRTLRGQIEILQRFEARGGLPADTLPILREEIVMRSKDALDTAFSLGEFGQLRELVRLVPSCELRGKLWLKSVIGRCPAPLNGWGRSILLAGSRTRGKILRQQIDKTAARP